MCLILFAYRTHPHYSLILAANRDEFHARPTAPASFWNTKPPLLAGRDLRSGGTWLGITANGRFAALSNYLDPCRTRDDAPSRGSLVAAYLLGSQSPEEFRETLHQQGGRYNGFSLLYGTLDRLDFYSNRGPVSLSVDPGVHGLSNNLLDIPWPKVERGKRILARITSEGDEPSADRMFDLLTDRITGDDDLQADDDITPDKERLYSNLFINGSGYGTRSSTVLMLGNNGTAAFIERTFTGDPDSYTTSEHRFRIEP